MTAGPAREQFEEILDHVADAVVVQAADGRLVHANRAAVELLGSPTLEALMEAADAATLAGRFPLRDEAGRELPWSRLPGRRALLGEDTAPAIVRWRPAGQDGVGPERWSRIKARPLRDPDGSVRLAISVIEDITEIKLAELGHRFLAEAGRVLASSLDLEATLRRVAELAVPEIADWCVIDIATRRGFDRVAVVHQDPAKLAVAEELMRDYPPDPDTPRGVPEVLRTGVAELYPVVSEELLRASARDDRHLELLRSVGMVSAMVVPLRGHEVLGAVTLVSSEGARSFGERDLAVAEELGRRGATAIENARLYHGRSEIARVLQQSLLPPELPEVERIATAAAFLPAGDGVDVGGDFYDLFPTSEEQWCAVIGDVCGKGPAAAAVTALARYTIRAAAVRRRSPAAILRRLNETMLRQRRSGQPFCTLAVARIDVAPAAVRVVACSAGHPLPRIVRADGGVEALGRSGTLLGVTRDVHLEDRSTTLAAGDTLLLYTDGLTEARAPAVVWDETALDAAIAAAAGGCGPQDLVDALAAAALGAEAAPARDDLAMLALRVLAAPG